MYEYIKELRENRLSNFESDWLPEFKLNYIIEYRDNGSYTFYTNKLGIIDYFPKANKALIREKNKWVKPGLKFLINELLIKI